MCEKLHDFLQEAYDAGARVFGENKVQEIMDKYDQLPSDIQWHMIGHLQRNKVKYIIDKVAMIHSVDSLRLAQTIDAVNAFQRICFAYNKALVGVIFYNSISFLKSALL